MVGLIRVLTLLSPTAQVIQLLYSLSFSAVLSEKSEQWWKDSLSQQNKSVRPLVDPPIALTRSHIVLEVTTSQIYKVLTESIRLNAPEKIVDDYSRRQLPRFRLD